MDHQAFAEMLGNYGEFLGSVAVLATLLYLAAQIRQSSALAKAQLETDVMQAFAGAADFPNQHPEVIAKLRAGVDLDDVETVLRDGFVLNYLFACAIGHQASKYADPDRTQRFVMSAALTLGNVDMLIEEHETRLRTSGYEEFVNRVKLELAN
jgi:hypothetical protein